VPIPGVMLPIKIAKKVPRNKRGFFDSLILSKKTMVKYNINVLVYIFSHKG